MESTDKGAVETARSALFVPGNRPDRFAKAAGSGADLVIIDLEDAVAPEHKEAARLETAAWLGSDGRAAVRINGTESEQCANDVAALAGVAGLLAVVVPMAEDQERLAWVGEKFGPGVPLVALVETARGLAGVHHLADVAAVARLGVGHLDLASDLRSSIGRDAMLLARSTVVLASRVAGLAGPFEGVTTVLDDPSVCADDAAYAKDLGFAGKFAIHPRQVSVINTVFSPTRAEIDAARRVMEAAGAGGVARVDGHMVDGPVVVRAKRVLELAAREAPGDE
jgi:citrate lyase subunit beta/citryl-CoA lyase